MKRYLPFVIIAAVLAVALVGGAVLFRSAQPTPQSPTALTPPPAGSPSIAPGIPLATVPMGAVSLVEFGDYQCPPCGIIHPMLKTLKQEFGARLHFTFYHLPLVVPHKHALDAAHAAVAASLQGRFIEMHDLLYESQKVWSESADIHPLTVNFARQLRLDVERFAREMDSERVAAVVATDMKRAESMGVTSTPTLILDGQLFPNEKISLENLRTVIKYQLAQRTMAGQTAPPRPVQ